MLTRRQMISTSTALAVSSIDTPKAIAEELPRISTLIGKSTDERLGTVRTLNSYHTFLVPKTLAEWETRSQALREQLLVAMGLWPLPKRTPLNAVIHGKIDRHGYTVEKVYFASQPGHYVSGNLYRPVTPLAAGEKRPAVLTPHGHNKNGRFCETADASIPDLLKTKAESTPEAAKYHLQAKCAMLARLGFVVFHYDMVGNADSLAIPHGEGFKDVKAELWSQNAMGLQTWNSFRAYDFLESLPDVDPKKIGVTGQSGGGTQTFILCALDPRPAVAFPAVMVSTTMQGGCVCENCSLLRSHTDNVEIAALFAPKPMAMSCADDWTMQFLKDGYGLPELKKLYGLYGKEENVAAKLWPQYPHNYNQPAREFMYSWFVKHLMGRTEDVKETPFVPILPKDLSVYDANHPRPQDEMNATALRKRWTTEATTNVKLRSREVVLPALRAMIASHLPGKTITRNAPFESKHDGVKMQHVVVGREGEQDAVPFATVVGKLEGPRVLWIHPRGRASLLDGDALAAPVKQLVDAGYAVVAPDLLGTGNQTLAKPYKLDPKFAGYTLGYNRSLFANRVHDILTGITYAKSKTPLHLIAWGEFGPLAPFAKLLAGDAVSKIVCDLNQFSFDAIQSIDDPMLLPGACKFGGLSTFVDLCGATLFAHNLPKDVVETGANRMKAKLSDERAVQWLIETVKP